MISLRDVPDVDGLTRHRNPGGRLDVARALEDPRDPVRLMGANGRKGAAGLSGSLGCIAPHGRIVTPPKHPFLHNHNN
jgi:hypothetical protein